jgi:predicted amidohydrolase
VRNTAVAVDSTGVIASYRKQHLYDAFGQAESEWIEPGEIADPETFVVDGLRFGLMTCYDLRFPEAARTLVDAGAEVLVVPAEWVRGPLKEHHWETLIAARAIENTVYVVAADHTPPIGVGRSMIVDPRGVVVAALGTETDVTVGWATRDRIAEVRAANPALELRRYRVTPAS